MNSYNIFLDDIRFPPEAFKYTKDRDYVEKDWIVCRNFDQFTKKIEKEFIAGKVLSLVSFDHDLAPEHYAPQTRWDDYNEWAKEGAAFVEKTGYDCAKWLKEFCTNYNMPIPQLKFHTMNPVGKENMQKVFNDK